MAKKVENPDLKVVLSIGGWTHGTGGFALASASAQSRQTFAENALKFITDNRFDGIDIDWEYPGFKGGPKQKLKIITSFLAKQNVIFTNLNLDQKF